jgi:hypothetical protein
LGVGELSYYCVRERVSELKTRREIGYKAEGKEREDILNSSTST